MNAVDSANTFGVVKSCAGFVQVMELSAEPVVLTPAEAINLAAWLFCMAETDGKKFAKMVEEIRK